MPTVVVQTNVQVDDARAFITELSKFAAETLSKPESYISVTYTHNPNQSFSGTFAPAFNVVITSLDNINPEANEKYSVAFFKFFKAKLGVEGDRGYITFYDPGRAYLGHQSTTFATIFGSD